MVVTPHLTRINATEYELGIKSIIRVRGNLVYKTEYSTYVTLQMWYAWSVVLMVPPLLGAMLLFLFIMPSVSLFFGIVVSLLTIDLWVSRQRLRSRLLYALDMDGKK